MTWNDLERARNDLKQHKTSKKRPKMTYHDLKRPAANKKQPGNDQKRAKNNLKQPTTSKTTYYDPNLLKTSKKKDAEQPTTGFTDYFTIWVNRFSSLTRFQCVQSRLQSFEHCFTKNHAENRAPNISILSCVFITGYKIYRIRCEPLWHS